MPEPKYYETKTFESVNEFHIACNLVRQKYSVHQHEYYELELILDGEAVHSINGESTRLSKGDVVFIIADNNLFGGSGITRHQIVISK